VSTTGVVLLHGKWDRPPHAIEALAQALRAAGHRCHTPDMPWSLARRYDTPLEAVFDTLAGELAALRASGCQRVVLGGHSLGAAAALGHAARHPGLDGLMLLSPGHFPERLAEAGHTGAALAQARAAGEAPARIPLVDVHQGRARRLRIAPRHYLDYFEPEGRLNWPRNAAALPPGLPVLWLVGTQDAAAGLGIDYALSRAPHHPAHAYLVIDAGHVSTPARGAGQVLAWLHALDT
jgi:pimeloyl-ACP methyl ester carboxylesterase